LNKSLRIAIVNDRPIAIEALRRVIVSVPHYTIAWIAESGTEAVTQAAIDRPDIILMDLLMPGLNGVEATRQIMAQSPCAILLVTGTVSSLGGLVFEAMGYGALDAVNTPILGRQGQAENGSELLRKIDTIARLIGKSSRSVFTPIPHRSVPPPLIIIGASTGGPQVLRSILKQFPAQFPAAIVIIQHIDAQFAPGFVDWLNQQIPLPAQIARTGDSLKPQTVTIAATNDHLILRSDLTLAYTAHPADLAYRPSVDVFFQSVAQHFPQPGIAILLTGMGRDGAEGLQNLRAQRWHTIAQTQASCVVYGMPKAAIEMGAAVEILDIDAIATACQARIRLPLP
jgi:two-component system, chemotaxis family, response regulator WspF